MDERHDIRIRGDGIPTTVSLTASLGTSPSGLDPLLAPQVRPSRALARLKAASCEHGYPAGREPVSLGPCAQQGASRNAATTNKVWAKPQDGNSSLAPAAWALQRIHGCPLSAHCVSESRAASRLNVTAGLELVCDSVPLEQLAGCSAKTRPCPEHMICIGPGCHSRATIARPRCIDIELWSPLIGQADRTLSPGLTSPLSIYDRRGSRDPAIPRTRDVRPLTMRVLQPVTLM